MTRDYSAGIYIGRFQPYHNSHHRIIMHGLDVADEVVLFIGSTNAARSVKNPFSYQERQDMIRSCFTADQNERINIFPARDSFYFDPIWFTQIQEGMRLYGDHVKPVCVLGAYKDGGNYFYKYFEGYDKQFVSVDHVNAADIRDKMLDENYGLLDYADLIPAGVQEYLSKWAGSEPHKTLRKQFLSLRQHHTLFQGYPYKRALNFVTVDCVVTHYGHVLVVTRRDTGDYALPGGFVNTDETLENAAIRELKEETRIKVDAVLLKSRIVNRHVFDYPGRSLRGRIITHAYHINLDIGSELPEVRGGDDAARAQWMQIADIYRNEDRFYDDHAQIIAYFLNGGKA